MAVEGWPAPDVGPTANVPKGGGLVTRLSKVAVTIFGALVLFRTGTGFITDWQLSQREGTVVFGAAEGDDVCSVRDQRTEFDRGRRSGYFSAVTRVLDGEAPTFVRLYLDDERIDESLIPADGEQYRCVGGTVWLADPGVLRVEIIHRETVEASGSVTVR